MWILIIETLFSIGVVINAALFIPQAVKLYRSKDSQTLSLTMFIGFNLIQMITIIHGYLHSDMLLILGTFLNLLTSGLITVILIVFKIQGK